MSKQFKDVPDYGRRTEELIQKIKSDPNTARLAIFDALREAFFEGFENAKETALVAIKTVRG